MSGKPGRKRVWIGLIGLIALVSLSMALSGCRPKSTPTSAPPGDGAEEPGGIDQPTDTQAPSSDSTEEPAARPTYTPTIAFIATIVVAEVDVHAGPGYEFPVVVTIDEPISVRVIGINPSKTWLFILLPDNQRGWMHLEAVEYDFDLDLLPVVKETPTPYGANLLVPPQLLGVTPASPGSPARRALSLIVIPALAVLILGASGILDRRPRRRVPASLRRVLHTLISLF